MTAVKRWQVDHRDENPVEYHAWDAVLTLWTFGWAGLAPAVLLDWLPMAVLCVVLYFTPRSYVWLRRRLHDGRRLRCDWLPALA